MNTQTPKQVVDAIRDQMRGSGFAGQSAGRVRVMIEYIEELERGLAAALEECEKMQAQIAGLTALNRSFEARQRTESATLDQMEIIYRRERDEAIKRITELEAQIERDRAVIEKERNDEQTTK